MRTDSIHRCANCHARSERFLCPRCATVCDSLTSAGLYREYLKGSIDEARLPRTVRRLLDKSPRLGPRPGVRHFLDDRALAVRPGGRG